jgi:hypothetical protein
MADPTLSDRLFQTRAQLDALACALARTDVEAIEASAQVLAHLVADLPGAVSADAAAAAVAPALADDLRWQLTRCRRLGATPATLPLAGVATLYRPDGQTREPHPSRPRLEVAG